MIFDNKEHTGMALMIFGIGLLGGYFLI